MKRIILTGGGTAGHVTPNIALLPRLKELQYDIHYIGSYNGIEKELIEQNLIELNPGYQRRSVWKDNKKKSLLIESLMLRIPIPAFYFYENEDGKYQVIDGQQRLTTIKEFVDGGFRLSKLEYLGTEYNKKKFKDLDTKYVQRIYRTQIAVNILDARSPKNVIYDIFRRVNTGGVNLNPQEMRNAICKQEVRDFLVKRGEASARGTGTGERNVK